jgi:hypothetical protein
MQNLWIVNSRSIITIQFRRKFSKYRVLFVNNRIVINSVEPNPGCICKVGVKLRILMDFELRPFSKAFENIEGL